MKKQSVDYQISFRGNKKECLDFEKLLNSRRVSIEQMRDWDDVNDEDNPPSGVIHWSKFKYLKFCKILLKEKDRPITDLSNKTKPITN